MRKYIISTQEELDNINKKQNSLDNIISKWSGCNYYINQGNNENEPLGTAQSIHDCEGCERFDYCKVKIDTPTWFWNEKIENEINEKWKSMFN